MTADPDVSQQELARLRAGVLADAALQGALQEIEDVDGFIAQARGLGFDIADAAFQQALRFDPVGISRYADAPPSAAVPQIGWLPINILPTHGQWCVDWAYFGAQPLRESFFEDSIRRVMRLPLNRLSRHRTRLADLAACVAQRGALRPSGFIFHMSRCGSTLISQMLAADPGTVMISEASPIDAVVRLDFGGGAEAGDAHAALLAAMVGALGQARAPEQARYFVKLDSWHTLALPLFRRAFPDVPWIFMYREPAEVMASQMLQRGMQTVPEYLPPALFGLTIDDAADTDDYCARILQRTCEAVVEPGAPSGGLLVNYREVPQVLWDRILPHFRAAYAPPLRAAMDAATKNDAKNPSMPFYGDPAMKQKMMTDALRATAERRLGAVYRRLETARLAGGAGAGL